MSAEVKCVCRVSILGTAVVQCALCESAPDLLIACQHAISDWEGDFPRTLSPATYQRLLDAVEKAGTS